MTVRRRARDAVTGMFVPVRYALLHPATTVIETVKRAVRGKRK